MHTLTLQVAHDHPAFGGHFPGQPLLPGVSLLAEVLEAVLDEPALAAIVGAAPRIAAAKFLAPVRPGARLTIALDEPALAALIGAAPRIASAKFLAPVRPGARLTLQLDAGARGVRFEVREGERVAASGQFEAPK